MNTLDALKDKIQDEIDAQNGITMGELKSMLDNEESPEAEEAYCWLLNEAEFRGDDMKETFKIAIVHEDGRKFFMEDGDGKDDIFESLKAAEQTKEYYFNKYEMDAQEMLIVTASCNLSIL